MKKSIKLLALLFAFIVAFACFAGCGSDNETADPSDTAAPSKKADTIVVGYTIYSPMNYLDDDGKLVGYDTELAEKVFGNLGYEVIFKEIIWDDKYTNLDSGVIDCIWNGFTANTADDDGVLRSEKVDFSYNYMENRQAIVVKDTSGIATADDLNGKIGAAENGSAGQEYAQSFQGVVFKGATKQTDCLFEVNSGTADFAAVDSLLAKSYCGKGDYSALTIIDGLSSDVEYYAIGFKKGSELTAKVNEQLEKLGADGTIDALAEKYGLANTAIRDFSDQIQ